MALHTKILTGPNTVTRNGSTIAYASYNLPTSIAAGANSSTLSYGAWRNRTKQVAVTSGVTETTIYVAGLVEKVTKGSTVEYRHQIEATPGTVAVYVRKSLASNIMYYLHRDHLGSPEMITNSSGTSLVKLSFSAYGERRDVDWDGPVSSTHLATAANTTRHGFTDHEHLDSVKLIHMGGRVYDPLIGRFLSRDPYIDGVGSSQGANGYGYVHNNPLSLWDPTGYDAEDLDEIVVTGRRSRWRSVFLEEFARFLSQPFAGGAPAGGGGPGGTDRTATPPAEPKEPGTEVPQEQQPTVECPGNGLNAGASFGAYAGPGAEFKGGSDLGNKFGTLRVGFGVGGGGSIDRAPVIPGPVFDRGIPGWVISVTYDFAVSWLFLDFGFSGGAARNLTSGESSPVFSPSVSGGAGTKFQISLGAEVTHYLARQPSSVATSCSTSGR
jgi:RHS repeat-associated protein